MAAVAFYLVVTLHVVACLFLIGVVLLQQGKSQDLASALYLARESPNGSRVRSRRSSTTWSVLISIASAGHGESFMPE